MVSASYSNDAHWHVVFVAGAGHNECVMKKKNYCKTELIYNCTASRAWYSCKFFRPEQKSKTYCKYLGPDNSTCGNPIAHRHSWEEALEEARKKYGFIDPGLRKYKWQEKGPK